MIQNQNPIICWFSCGAASAIATYFTTREYANVRVVYIHLGGEHPDNMRFIADCQRVLGYNVEIITPKKYQNHWEVLKDKRFLNSPHGAPCTKILKKETRYRLEDEIKVWDGQVMGFTCEETRRAKRFAEQYPSTKPMFPLIQHSFSKSDCLGFLERKGIKLPLMYEQGFMNNNCIGCVKGGKGYWSRIRHYYPEAFIKMSYLERAIGHSCINGCYLDELPSDYPMNIPIISSCSLFCDVDFMNN